MAKPPRATSGQSSRSHCGLALPFGRISLGRISFDRNAFGRISFAITAFSAGVFVGNAQAQEQPLPAVVVTATRSAEPIDQLISDVTILDGDPAHYALSLPQRLRFAGGVQISSNGGPGAVTSVLIRGANSGHTLTLIDGFRVSSASLGQTTFEALPLGGADRVEILRGPASSFYGADALGGVVQLLSRPAQQGLRIFGEAALGGEATRQVRTGLSTGNDAVTGSVRIGQERSEGFNATTPANFAFNPDRDGYRRESVSARVDARLSAATRVRAIALQNRLDSDYDDGDFAGARTEARIELLGVTASHELDARTALEARVGQTTDRSRSVSSFPGTFESRLRQYGVSAQRQFGNDLTLKLLFERLEESVDSTAYDAGATASRTTNSAGLIATGNSGPHRIQAGVRLDHSNQFDTQTNATVAYGYRLGGGLRVGASYATGFHAPGFNDLFFPGFGRPGIRPERARTTEIGAYWNGDVRSDGRSPESRHGGRLDQGSGSPARHSGYGKIVLFQSQVRDLITFEPNCPDPDPQFRFGCADNVDRARITGASLLLGQRGVGARQTGFGWRVGVDLLDARNLTRDSRLPRRAKSQLTAAVDYGIGDTSVGADLLVAGRRFDDTANLRELGGYMLLNLRAGYRFGVGWELFGQLFNATDRQYATALDYTRQGRLLLLGVRYDGG